MEIYKSLQSQIINLDDKDFPEVALRVFYFQAEHNQVYKTYLNHLGVNPEKITVIDQIPFLPIELFKTQKVVTGNWEEELVFSSSGTGSGVRSKHFIKSLDFYKGISKDIFERHYGPLSKFHILALLPNYLEQAGSSLVTMVDHFITCSNSNYSGFYLNDPKSLLRTIKTANQDRSRTTLLWGVSFALMDLAECVTKDGFPELMIMETGGMKGRREEITRRALHEVLCRAFAVDSIHSEYGMAELTSQAYASRLGSFQCPIWMRVYMRSLDDPLVPASSAAIGGINIIDLSNIHSCSFIATDDLGRSDGESFEVMGRIDNSELRGCNLLI